jgi:chemotaxis protein MotA
MDLATIIGIVSGLTLISGAIFLGGSFETFVNIPGLMIVFGGTIAATLTTFPFEEVKDAFKAAFKVFVEKKKDPHDVVMTMVKLSRMSGRSGFLSLQKIDAENPLLKKGCQLIADSADKALIRDTLRIEIESLKQRHSIRQRVFTKMGTFAPSFGMLGTVIGLVHMLRNLKSPDDIGPAMAIAILTTFYGILLSTLFFLPIAGKLKARTELEVLNLEIIFEGAVTILESKNPLMVYEKLSSFVDPKLRKSFRLRGIAGEESEVRTRDTG